MTVMLNKKQKSIWIIIVIIIAIINGIVIGSHLV